MCISVHCTNSACHQQWTCSLMPCSGCWTPRAYPIRSGTPWSGTIKLLQTTSDQGRLYRLQIDGQARSSGLPSLKEAITTTYGAAIWMAQLLGFPSDRPVGMDVDERSAQEVSSEEDSDGVTDLTIQDGQESYDETSDEDQGYQICPERDGLDFKQPGSTTAVIESHGTVGQKCSVAANVGNVGRKYSICGKCIARCWLPIPVRCLDTFSSPVISTLKTLFLEEFAGIDL